MLLLEDAKDQTVHVKTWMMIMKQSGKIIENALIT